MVTTKTVKGLLVLIILLLLVVSPVWATKAVTSTSQEASHNNSTSVDFKNGLFSIAAKKTPLVFFWGEASRIAKGGLGYRGDDVLILKKVQTY